MDSCRFMAALSSSSGKPVEDIINDDFSVSMLLYNLFGNCDNVDITIDNYESNRYNINCDYDIMTINNISERMILSIHDNKYIVNSKAINTGISVTIAGMG